MTTEGLVSALISSSSSTVLSAAAGLNALRSHRERELAVNASPGSTSGVVPSTRLFVAAAIGSSAANGRPAGTHTWAYGYPVRSGA